MMVAKVCLFNFLRIAITQAEIRYLSFDLQHK